MVGFMIFSVILVIVTGITPEEWKQWWNDKLTEYETEK